MKLQTYIIRVLPIFSLMLFMLTGQAYASSEVAACFSRPSFGQNVPSDANLQNALGLANCIKVNSFSFGAENNVSFSKGSGAVIGRAAFSEVTLSRFSDNASPTLMTNLVSGSHFQEIVLVSINRQGPSGSVEVPAFWQFGLAYIKKIEINDASDEANAGIETIQIVFGEMKATVGNRSVRWSVINNSTAIKNIDDKLAFDNLDK